MRSAVRGSSSACHDAPVLCGLNIPVVNELLGLVNRSREKRANTIVGHTRAPAGVHACAWLAADSWLWRRFRRWCASAHLRLHLRRSLQPAARLRLGRHGRTRLPRSASGGQRFLWAKARRPSSHGHRPDFSHHQSYVRWSARHLMRCYMAAQWQGWAHGVSGDGDHAA